MLMHAAINHVASTNNSISVNVFFDYNTGTTNGSSTLKLKRDGIVVSSEAFVEDYANRTYFSSFTDTGGFWDVAGSGLEPGTTYKYEVFLDDILFTSADFCTC